MPSAAPAALRPLRLPAATHTQLWNKEDPCCVAGFDMEPLGAAEALAAQPEGAVVCCLSVEQPGSVVLSCKQPPGAAGASGSAGDEGVLQAVLTTEDLMERRLETWLRDLQAATHVLDVYRGRRTAKAVVLGSDKYTRLRAMEPLEAYDDILI
jgi:hypothetical protein